MPKKSRPYINKKKAVRFKVVYRSQHDPLIVDENAPARVLKPILETDLEKRHEEQEKYGIYFDDDYDYLQHLKTVDRNDQLDKDDSNVEDNLEENDDMDCKTKARIQLPSSVFASEFQEEIGMLNKYAPDNSLRLDLDPDIVAALDDDFDYDNPENALEDDFVEIANQGCISDELSDEQSEDDCYSVNGSEKSFYKEETRSCFTNYSMSSSCLPRNEMMSFIDDEFEKFYELNYNNNDLDDIDAFGSSGYTASEMEMLKKLSKDHFESKRRLSVPECEFKSDINNKTLEILQNDDGTKSSDELESIDSDPSEKWDCVSFLSTYSNIYNHPKIIDVPNKKLKKIDKINKKSAVIETINDENLIEKIKELSTREKNESKDVKNTRKKLLKEARRQRRVQKKEHKLQFAEQKNEILVTTSKIRPIALDKNF